MKEEIRHIKPARRPDESIKLPSSKSYTNRALIAAALAEGESTILAPSESDDTQLLIAGLEEFGVPISKARGRLVVQGSGGKLALPKKEIFTGNAGTAMRFLAALAALSPGEVRLSGNDQMNVRPIGDLLAALKRAGIGSSCTDGHPPVVIRGAKFQGGPIDIDASVSSQFLSSLLLIAPYARRQVILRVIRRVASEPYIHMTLHIMRSFGAVVDTLDFRVFTIEVGDHYIGREYAVEADASAASYFLGAAAITGGCIRLPELSRESLQGDVGFVKILTEMGCTLVGAEEGIELRGGHLRGIEVDMNSMPDCVPTLAVVAAFADGPTAIENIANLRFKETDRLAAIATELRRMGGKIEVADDQLIIHPRPLHGAVIETYGDHRMAMCFALAGLRVDGIGIKNPRCVTKSFPGFWEEFNKLESEE